MNIKTDNKVIKIQIKSGKSLKNFSLPEKKYYTIGSIESADICLSSEVDPIHCVFEYIDGSKIRIYDLASNSGTFYKGKRIVTTDILVNESIIICGTEIFFQTKTSISNLERPESLSHSLSFQEVDESSLYSFVPDDVKNEDIFKSTSGRSIEVVMSWCGVIHGVYHFNEGDSIYLGMNRDILFPDFLLSKSEPIYSAGHLSIPKDFKCVHFSNSSLKTVYNEKVNFKDGDFLKLSLLDIDLFFIYSDTPPKLKVFQNSQKDLYFSLSLGISLATTFLMILFFLNTKVSENKKIELDKRVAKILLDPNLQTVVQKIDLEKNIDTISKPLESKNEPPKKVVIDLKPKEVKIQKKPDVLVIQKPSKQAQKPKALPQNKKVSSPKSSQKGGLEGEGARAKGREGTRGQVNAKKSNLNQDLARRQSPQGGTGRGGGAQSEVPDQGNIDSLKSTAQAFQSLLGNTSNQLKNGGEVSAGYGTTTTAGSGGKALSGQGVGGGGVSDVIGGLGKSGRGGGKVGTGLGAAGSGSGFIGGNGSGRVEVRTGGVEETIVEGGIDADAIRAAILAKKDEFRLCYEREINSGNPGLSGRVSTSFEIGPQGRVTSASVASTTLNNRNTEQCILLVLKSIQFPKPQGGGLVQVKYPFKFRSIGQ